VASIEQQRDVVAARDGVGSSVSDARRLSGLGAAVLISISFNGSRLPRG
jgi:hypothetical protein